MINRLNNNKRNKKIKHKMYKRQKKQNNKNNHLLKRINKKNKLKKITYKDKLPLMNKTKINNSKKSKILIYDIFKSYEYTLFIFCFNINIEKI